jgi:hypothetical protein
MSIPVLSEELPIEGRRNHRGEALEKDWPLCTSIRMIAEVRGKGMIKIEFSGACCSLSPRGE